MSLPRLALRNRAFTGVVVGLVALLGLQSYRSMPRSEDPQFDISASRVVAVFPGATPEDIESLVVDPLETAINEADDIKKLETTIQDGVALVRVEFETGTDPDETFDDVNQAVSRVRPALPGGVALLEAFPVSPTETPIFQAALVSETASDLVMKREADRLADAVERVRSVQRAEVFAAPAPEVRVGLDLERLRELGVPFEQALGAIRSAAPSLPGGSVDAGDRRFTVQTSGDFASVEDVRRTVVAGEGSRVVYLEDVADVGLASADDAHRARYDGQRAVWVTAVQRAGTNIFDVREGLATELAAFERALPPGVEVRVVFDQAVAVEERVGGFFGNLVQGVLLVGLVVLLALGARASAVVMLAIPLSVLAAVFVLDVTDYGLQQISIVGLVVALGLLVDNAIVVVENVAQKLREGLAPFEAAVRGAEEVGPAVVVSTATTVFSFLPIILVESGASDFIRSLPLTVIYALVASLAISLTVTPLLTARLLQAGGGRFARLAARARRGLAQRLPARFRPAPGPPSGEPDGDDVDHAARVGGPLQRVLDRVRDGPYTRTLRGALGRPALTLGVAVLALVGGAALIPVVGVSLFPKAEKPFFLVDVTTDEGTSLDRTDAVVADVERWLAEQPEVAHLAANVGRGHPQAYYNVYPRRERPTVGQILVETHDARDVDGLARRVLREVVVPGADLDVEVFENGPPVEAPIAIKVVGPDLDVLADLAAKVEAAVEATPGTEDVENPLAQPRTDLRVAVDRERAGLLGVSLAALDQTVLAALAGLPVATYRDAANDDVPVVVRLPYDAATDDPDGETRRPTLSDLDRVSVTAASGARVPLGQLATVRLEREPSQIDHVDLERAVTVTADAVPGTNEIAVTTAVLDRLDGLALPPGYRLQVGGKLEAQQESFGALGGALAVAMLAIFGVLVLQFRSLLQPLVVFAAIPLSAAGAFPALALTGVSFSFMAFIGLTSLVGIVVNNSILLVDTANRLRDAGDAVEDAVRGAARSRFAPILLTTMTTVGGLTPLLLTNSDLWTPLAAVIVGGLLASTGLTLLVVPVLYRLLTRDEAGGAETGGADGERTDTNGTADADPDAPGTTGASASASGDGLPAEPARPPVGGDEA